MAGRLDQFGVQLQAAKLLGDPLGGPAHVVAMGAVGADAGNAQQLAQSLLEAVLMFAPDIRRASVMLASRTVRWIRSRLSRPLAPFTAWRLPVSQLSSRAAIALTAGLQYNGCGPIRPSRSRIARRGASRVTEQIASAASPSHRRTDRASDTEQARKKPKRQPRYNVILWDDQDHTLRVRHRDDAAAVRPPASKRAFRSPSEVDNRGRAIVLTTTREHAELKRDQIHAFGKDALIASCQGSMSATHRAGAE